MALVPAADPASAWRGLAWHQPRYEPVPPRRLAGPVQIPATTLAHLRGLKRAYDEAVDVTVQLLGFERGGCALDLVAGVIYPPEWWTAAPRATVAEQK